MEGKKLFRMFIAIQFSDEVIKEVARVQKLISKQKFTGKLTELENIHLTLKFLGEIDFEMAEKVQKKLEEIKINEITAKLGGIGTFCRKNSCIVWIKLNGKELFELQKKIDDLLKGFFKPEERFMSHITVGRVKYVKDIKNFKKMIESISVRKIGFKIKKFQLKLSELNPLWPVYSNIKEYNLNNWDETQIKKLI